MPDKSQNFNIIEVVYMMLCCSYLKAAKIKYYHIRSTSSILCFNHRLFLPNNTLYVYLQKVRSDMLKNALLS